MQIISDDVDNMDKEMLDGCINFNSIWVARWLDDIGLAQYKGNNCTFYIKKLRNTFKAVTL